MACDLDAVLLCVLLQLIPVFNRHRTIKHDRVHVLKTLLREKLFGRYPASKVTCWCGFLVQYPVAAAGFSAGID
jgi:hypothetical protein